MKRFVHGIQLVMEEEGAMGMGRAHASSHDQDSFARNATMDCSGDRVKRHASMKSTALGEECAIFMGCVSVGRALLVKTAKNALMGYSVLSANTSVTHWRHAAYEAGVVHLVRASAMPTRPERLVLSAPTAALVPRVNHLATGTARAGGMAGARRRGRASVSLAFLDQVFPLFPDLSRVLI